MFHLRSALEPQKSAVSSQHLKPKTQHSALRESTQHFLSQHSALSTQHSALSTRHYLSQHFLSCRLPTDSLPLSTQHSALSTFFRSTEKLKSNKLVFLVILYTANNLNRRCIIAQVIIRNIEDDLKIRLKVRATQHGWSIEEEVCQILRTAVTEASPTRQRLGSRIAARFAGVGLLEPLPELRGHTIAPMDFGA